MSERTKHSLTPTQKLWQAVSDFLIGFSIFLIVSGIIGTAVVLQNLQENESQDLRSEASTAEVVEAELVPVCETIDVCLPNPESEDGVESCSSQEICEVPPNCYYEAINCVTEPCPYAPLVLICPSELDDLFFADTTELDSPEFYADEQMTTKVPEEELKEGNRYYIKSQVSVQNALKNSNPSDLSFGIRLKVNGSLDTAKLVRYTMLTAHRDGYVDTLSGPFTAERINTVWYEVGAHDNDGTIFIPETNYDNNKHEHTFEAKACENNPDLNGDEKVDLRDFAILSREFLSRRAIFTADINCDNTVDMRDYSIMANNFTVNQ